MAFHFQPQADSSDEEEQVDLSSWQTGAKPQRGTSPPAAAVAVMQELAGEEDVEDSNALSAFASGALATMSGAGDEADEEDGAIAIDDSATPDIASSTNESRTRNGKSTTPFVSPGFTSINKPAPASPPSSEEDDRATEKIISQCRRTTSRGRPTKRQRVLVPIIPRVELDSDEEAEIIDFTTGGDVVRRVKKELRDRDGDLQYRVEFEDRRVEEVSCLPFCVTNSYIHVCVNDSIFSTKFTCVLPCSHLFHIAYASSVLWFHLTFTFKVAHDLRLPNVEAYCVIYTTIKAFSTPRNATSYTNLFLHPTSNLSSL